MVQKSGYGSKVRLIRFKGQAKVQKSGYGAKVRLIRFKGQAKVQKSGYGSKVRLSFKSKAKLQMSG